MAILDLNQKETATATVKPHVQLKFEDLWEGQRLDAESLLALRCISEAQGQHGGYLKRRLLAFAHDFLYQQKVGQQFLFLLDMFPFFLTMFPVCNAPLTFLGSQH